MSIDESPVADSCDMPAYTAGGSLLPPVDSLTTNPKLLARFYAKIRTKRGSGCWIWNASRDEKGYGWFSVFGRMLIAHRVSFAIANGRWASPDRMVLHSCDNPSCVNPAHLREGTATDNNREIVERGHHENGATKKRNRHALESGTEKWRAGASERILVGRSRLSPFDVKAIRDRLTLESPKEEFQAVADEYAVPTDRIRAVVRRAIFAWVY